MSVACDWIEEILYDLPPDPLMFVGRAPEASRREGWERAAKVDRTNPVRADLVVFTPRLPKAVATTGDFVGFPLPKLPPYPPMWSERFKIPPTKREWCANRSARKAFARASVEHQMATRPEPEPEPYRTTLRDTLRCLQRLVAHNVDTPYTMLNRNPHTIAPCLMAVLREPVPQWDGAHLYNLEHLLPLLDGGLL